MKTFTQLSLIAIGLLCISTSNPKTSTDEFKVLCGMWKGTLTYLDYTSGKPYSMPANVEVRLIENSNSFILNDTYPDEPQANSSDTLQISADGRMVDNETVQLNRLLKNGEREIITQTKGIDGNQRKPATIQHIYTIGKVHFSIKKLVKFDTDTAFFLRHEYAYTR